MSNQVSNRKHQGIILITAMWVLVVLGALVLIFARSMRVEVTASANRLATQQASTIELGAERYVMAAIDGSSGDALSVLQTPAEQIQLGDGYFWILQTDPTDDNDYAFGITDECSKLNLNYATDPELTALPGMTQEVADSIIDWRDTDETVTGQGAESSYYQALPRPYSSKNAPFESVEELTLVKGVTDTILWGYDLDHNGMIDSVEQSAGGEATAFNSANDTGRGIVPFLTVWTKEPNTDPTGKKRILIAPVDRNGLRQLLAKNLPTRATQIMARAGLTQNFRNVFDFANRTGITDPNDLAKIIDYLTISRAPTTPGLINVNTASQQVLMALPGITQAEATAIVSSRPTSSTTGGQSDPTSIAWLMKAISPQKAGVIGAQVTGRSFFYSADIVAVSVNGRAFKRVRVVLDARSSPPVMIYRKDLTNLGWPLSPDIRTALRAGKPLPAASGMGTGGANGLSQLQH